MKSEKKYKALFLDMDGTFLDFQTAEREAFFRTFASLGLKADEEICAEYSRINLGLWKAFERGEIEKQQIRDSRFPLLFEALGLETDGLLAEKNYEKFLGEGHALMPHAREVLEWLSARYPLYVVTNGFKHIQTNRLKLADIDRFMTQKFISEDIGYQKPQKEFFQVCFERMEQKFLPEEILVIGDSLTSDIRGAANAGLDSCWFNPQGEANCSGVQPDYEIKSLLALKKLLAD